MNILPIDELNTLTSQLSIHFDDGKMRSKEDYEDIIDELLDFFLLAYANGVQAANTDLGTDIKPTVSEAESAINESVAGKTWRERVREYYESGGDEYDIQRIAETDMTRIYNTAVLDVAAEAARKDAKAGTKSNIRKRWNAVMDDKTRETHFFLDGVTIPLDAYFVSFDGDQALAPGLFTKPENVINCRCVCELVRG